MRRRLTTVERHDRALTRMTPGTLGGRLETAAPVQTTRVPIPASGSGGGGGQDTTFLVAASDALDSTKAKANYLCDGTDDHVEIQAAIDDAWNVNLGRVVLSEGNFYVSDTNTVKSYMTLSGMSQATTALVGPGGLYLDTAAVVENLAVLRDSAGAITDPPGITSRGDSNTIRGVRISSFYWGILATTDGTSSTVLQVMGCLISGNHFGIQLDNIEDAGHLIVANLLGGNTRGIYSLADGQIIANRIAGAINTDSGIFVAGGGSFDARTLVANNIITGHNDGIYIDGAYEPQILGNLLLENGRDGIYVNAPRCQIHDNKIRDAGQQTANTYDGILVDSGGDECSIQGNFIRGTSMRYGIRIAIGASDVFVTNNDLKGAGTTGQFSDAGTATVTAAGNRT